jgi:DNA processing protein
MLHMENNEKDLLKYLLLADMPFLTLREKINLQNKLDSAAQLALMSINAISEKTGRVLKSATWDGAKSLEKAQRSIRLFSAFSIGWSLFECDDYPVLLREMNDPPYMLFYRGSLEGLSKATVSVVGTRQATGMARSAAITFAHDAAADGTTVVSGLAYGIDICAHQGALEVPQGCTAAVLPSGIDTIIPAQHVKAACRIIQSGGCLLSEYTPGTPALPFRFVQRNRLIAALSPSTVVIQAPSGSGALITASFALEYGRDVVFHEVAFSEESQLLEKMKVHDLQKLLHIGKKVAYKIENSPERYRADGAQVIANYAEYRLSIVKAPGTVTSRRNGTQQCLF